MKLIHSITAVFFFLVLGTSNLSFAGGDLSVAPPSFQVSGKQAVFIDFKKMNLSFEIDAQNLTATGTARIDFEAGEAGYPILDLLLSATSVVLDGVELGASALKEIQAPKNETTYRMLDAEVTAGSTHQLEIVYDLTPVVKFKGGQAALFFAMFDVDPDRAFLEQYAPTNLEFDPFALELSVNLVGTSEEHRIFTNGDFSVNTPNRWNITFPEYYRSSSFFFHLVPSSSITEMTKTFQGKKKFPVTVYAAKSYASSIPKVMKDSLAVLQELEDTYGAFAHEKLIVYSTNDPDLSMEFCGATISYPEHIDHEIFHSYFGRGMMPVDGNSGWMDEGLARWRDDHYPHKKLPLTLKPVNLAGFSPYRRTTSDESYAKGSRLFSGIDDLLSDQGGLRQILKEYYEAKQMTGVKTGDLQDFLEKKSGLDFSEYFDRYVMGKGSFVEGQTHVDFRSTAKPLALVYRGPGSCIEECSSSSAEMAKLQGFRVRYVSPTETDLSIFGDAAIWIQPGGESLEVAKNMNSALKNAIREFVKNGGGYVGFCAGGLFATDLIGESNVHGLGIFPGVSRHYSATGTRAQLIPIEWSGSNRVLYFEEGPYFETNAEIVARYPNGQTAAARASFGQGRVFISGPHPEAPQSWRTDFGLNDPDGLDFSLAGEMIRWASRVR